MPELLLRRMFFALILASAILTIAANPTYAVTTDVAEEICSRYKSLPYVAKGDVLTELLDDARKAAPNSLLVVCLYESSDFLGAASDVVTERKSGKEEAWLIGFQRAFNDEAEPATIRFFFMHEVGHFMLKHYRICTGFAAEREYAAYSACESTADIYAADALGYCEAARALGFLREFSQRHGQPIIVDHIFKERIAILTTGRNCAIA